MAIFLISIIVLVASGVVAAIARKNAIVASWIGSGGTIMGGVIGLIAAIGSLSAANPESMHLGWSIPYGALSLQIDSLSAFFLILIFSISVICAIYGRQYLAEYPNGASHTWFYFNLLVASMALVVTARNAVLFLMVWEIMALSSFFLVILDGDKESVKRAGIIYLIATQIGTAFLLVLFILLGKQAGSFDFASFEALKGLSPALTGVILIFALIGFGSKAGFIPLHVWLPEAHPAAPSHVSALMSGLMIKTGIYGLLRVFSFIDQLPAWGIWLLIAIGFVSSVGGILFASAQHDLKRLLAYSSVENVGIIALALGVGSLGCTLGIPEVAFLGITAALFHVMNHAIYKTLLFLGAGAILHSTGSLQLNRLGGLLGKLPWIGVAFLVGSLAICGLPPLNGIASELLLYLAVIRGGTVATLPGKAMLVPVAFALLWIGGLSVVTFTKAFGAVFLGNARDESIYKSLHKPGASMQGSLLVLAFVCVLLGVLAPWVGIGIGSIAASIKPFSSVVSGVDRLVALRPLFWLSGVNFAVILMIVIVASIRQKILLNRKINKSVTWDCGYAFPSSRMQYSASSFVQPVTEFFKEVLRSKTRISPISSHFPHHAEFETDTKDIFLEHVFVRFSLWLDDMIGKLRKIQYGRIQVYILYILVTLVALLIWHLGISP